MLTRLIILFFILNANFCFAQSCLDIILGNRLYSKSDDIINGRQWINEKRYSGSPLLIAKYWPTGDVYYNGLTYSGLVINYDLFREEMIIYHDDKATAKYVVISNEKLKGFTFNDSILNRKHTYEYRELPGIDGKSLYENASAGAILFYVKPIKKVELRSISEGSGEYTDSFEYYLNSDGRFVRINSRGQLLKHLPDKRNELKKYMRSHNFKFSGKHPGNIIDLIRYCNSLI